MISAPTMNRFIGENKVKLVGIFSVTAPAVCLERAATLSLATCRGIDPDSPPCHTKNPVYADAIRSL